MQEEIKEMYGKKTNMVYSVPSVIYFPEDS